MIYVTFQLKYPSVLANKTEYYAVRCNSKEEAIDVAIDACSLFSVLYVRINKCGRLKHKKDVVIIDAKEYFSKYYGKSFE